jgi:hypothetical protein
MALGYKLIRGFKGFTRKLKEGFLFLGKSGKLLNFFLIVVIFFPYHLIFGIPFGMSLMICIFLGVLFAIVDYFCISSLSCFLKLFYEKIKWHSKPKEGAKTLRRK